MTQELDELIDRMGTQSVKNRTRMGRILRTNADKTGKIRIYVMVNG